jgi:hypothetical protein
VSTDPEPAIVAPYPSDPPRPNGEPSISGAATVGQLLTCEKGFWRGSPTFAYQWFSNGAEIVGATSSEYTTVGADEGTAIQCRVSGTSAGMTTVAFSSRRLIEALAPTATAAPEVSNVTDPGESPEVGDELSCAPGTWSNSPTFAYQWLRNGAEIGAATASTHTVVAEDQEKILQCRVMASNGDATAQASSERIFPLPLPAGEVPELTDAGNVLTGFPAVGETLGCETGTWSGSPTLSRQWLQNGVEIGGETASTYTLLAADRGTLIQCRVTATSSGGTAVAIRADSQGARYVNPNPPSASAEITNELNISFTALSEHGEHFFYTQGNGFGGFSSAPGRIFSYDTATQATTEVTPVDDAQVVNVSADGSHLYFISQSQIGGEGTAGQPNLYVWERAGATTTFVGTLAAEDPGKLNWNAYVSGNDADSGPALIHARTTPDGSVMVFESKAQLTAYDNAGHREVYRYDAAADELACVSCAGAGPATGDAQLQTQGKFGEPNKPLTAQHPVPNVSDDGGSVVFESTEQLVAKDTNAKLDVYRWESGEGLALISSGEDAQPAYLYGATTDHSDILFVTYDHLLPQDENTLGAIYDARIGGGFPPPEEFVTEPCVGDACQGTPSAAPPAPGAASAELVGQGNVTRRRDCSGPPRRARTLAKRAKALNRRAREADSPRQAKALRRRAASLSQKADQVSQSARRCRRANRRAAR